MIEYPGFSIYEDLPDPNTILKDSLIVYDWIKSKFYIVDDHIFICGRSLGTSPAIYLSSTRNPNALFLISPFTTLKNSNNGYTIRYFIEDIFKSYEYIKYIRCPVLLIHGKKDKFIDYYLLKYYFQK